MIAKLLATAFLHGYTVEVSYSGEIDYKGNDVAEALDAIEACDEIEVTFFEAGENIGWAFICNDLDDDEKIVDCTGYVDRWLDQLWVV